MPCMLTTHYLLIAAISPAPLDDCQSLKHLLYHTQNSSGEEAALPLLKLSLISQPFQQIIDTELFNIFLAFRPCLLSSNTEVKITKLLTEVHTVRTRGTNHKPKQETSQLGVRKQFFPLRQSSIGCSKRLRNLHPWRFLQDIICQNLKQTHLNLVLTPFSVGGWIR